MTEPPVCSLARWWTETRPLTFFKSAQETASKPPGTTVSFENVKEGLILKLVSLEEAQNLRLEDQ